MLDVLGVLDTADVRDIQIQELDILKRIREICERHGITYYLIYGTLIGAIRHQGFIPWDDDVDIMMTRDNYEQFFSHRDELGEDFIVQDWRTTPDFWSFHAKVRQLRPKPYIDTMVEDVTDKNGMFVDIFLLDYLPKQSSFRQSVMARVLDTARLTLSAKQYGHHDPSPMVRLLSHLARLVPKSLIKAIMLWGSTRWNDGPRNWVVSYGAMMNHRTQVSPIEAYGQPVLRPFEDTEMPCPQDHDLLLRGIYGDYMQLPPVSERTAHGFRRNLQEQP